MNNYKECYEYLRARLRPMTAAGVLGNLIAESNCNPKNLQNSCEKRIGMNDSEYTAAVDSGRYTLQQFMYDSAGYGICQWTSPGRKKYLYEYIKKRGASIGDLYAQLEFLHMELRNNYNAHYKTLINSCTAYLGAETFLRKFECPKDQSEKVLLNRMTLGVAQAKKCMEKIDGVKLSGKLLMLRKPYTYDHDVYNLQMFINKLYASNVLTVDGKFGSRTKEWVQLFQRDNNLTQDGKVGPNTHAVIKQYLS